MAVSSSTPKWHSRELRAADSHCGIRHLEYPANTLVIADNGNRSLAAAKPGALTRAYRHRPAQRSRRALDRPGAGWLAPTFDGQRFFVQQRESVLCLDAQSEGAEALWRVSDASFLQSLDITHGPGHLLLFTRDWNAASASTWEYVLPSFTLRKRVERACPDLGEVRTHLGVGGTRGRALQLVVNADGGPPLLGGEDLGVELPERDAARPTGLRWCDAWAIATHGGPTGCWLDVVSLGRGQCVFSLPALGARRLATALEGHRLAVVDDRGRLADIDHQRHQLLRDVRLFA